LSSAFVSASAVLAALWPTPQAVGWRHGSVHDAQHIGSVDKPRERWAGARRQGRGSRGTWLRWRELCVLESNAGHCELQISGGMRVITRHSSPEIGRDAMALVSGKQGSWRPSRCQRGADTCRWARALVGSHRHVPMGTIGAVVPIVGCALVPIRWEHRSDPSAGYNES
jgi:hypothetical protein